VGEAGLSSRPTGGASKPQQSALVEGVGGHADDEGDATFQTASAPVTTVTKRSPLSRLMSQAPSAS
jgi:hypothetical protein